MRPKKERKAKEGGSKTKKSTLKVKPPKVGRVLMKVNISLFSKVKICVSTCCSHLERVACLKYTCFPFREKSEPCIGSRKCPIKVRSIYGTYISLWNNNFHKGLCTYYVKLSVAKYIFFSRPDTSNKAQLKKSPAILSKILFLSNHMHWSSWWQAFWGLMVES